MRSSDGEGGGAERVERALLVADIADSTRMVAELGDARAAEVWAAHDRAARDLLSPHGGREIDKTDGFLLIFARASDAVAYALAYHAALASLEPPLMARVGVHVGPVVLRANRPEDVARGAKPVEVEGLAKPVAARVQSLASPGRTLLTAAARAALPAGFDDRVHSHGWWRFKGLPEPLEVFELHATGAFVAPADAEKAHRVVRHGDLWLPARDVPRSLPAERDGFVGRADDLDALTRRLDAGARLVSVLGLGGTGKTRLVVRFGWGALADFPGGVWFADLSEARDPEGLVAAVARALGLAVAGDPVAAVGRGIASRGRCLVILDNFEQVSRFAYETVGRWLDAAPAASFVVTSREVLGLRGEEVLALAPLDATDAAALFELRASSAAAAHVADPEATAALVALLDGLPLAIELAAARVRAMGPRRLLERARDRFQFLVAPRGRTDRQATLRATLDWSWELSTVAERAALAQLAVFEGGFTLDAVEGVLSIPDASAADVVEALVDRSWVRRVDDDRLDVLVTVQEYAALRLAESGGVAEAEARHAAWYADWADATYRVASGGGAGRAGAQRALLAELDNLLTATRRAIGRADGPTAARLALSAHAAAEASGALPIVLTLVRSALGLSSVPTIARAWLLVRAGAMEDAVGRSSRALADLDEAITLAEALPAPEGPRLESAARSILGGNVLARLGRVDEARAHLGRAVALCRARGDDDDESVSLVKLGMLELSANRLDAAASALEAALARFEAAGRADWRDRTLANLGNVAWYRGERAAARTRWEAALHGQRAAGAMSSVAISLGNLGIVDASEGRWDEAIARSTEAAELHRRAGNFREVGISSLNLAFMLDRAGRAGAEPLVEEALRHSLSVEDRATEVQARVFLADRMAARGQASAAEARLEEALGRAERVPPRIRGFVYAAYAERCTDPERARSALTVAEEAARGIHDEELTARLERARAQVAGRDER